MTPTTIKGFLSRLIEAPQILAEDHDGRSADVPVRRRKYAASERRGVKEREKISGDDRGVDEYRLAVTSEGELMALRAGYFAEDMILIAQRREIKIGPTGLDGLVLGGLFKNVEKLIGVRVRKGFYDDGVYDAENCSVGADAEGQGDYCDGGESGIVAQHAEGVARVLQEHFEEGQAAKFAIRFLKTRGISQADASRAYGFCGRHTAANILLSEHGEMRIEFASEIVIDGTGTKPAANAGSESAHAREEAPRH